MKKKRKKCKEKDIKKNEKEKKVKKVEGKKEKKKRVREKVPHVVRSLHFPVMNLLISFSILRSSLYLY